MGIAFLWHTRKSMIEKAPDTIPEALLQDTPEGANA